VLSDDTCVIGSGLWPIETLEAVSVSIRGNAGPNV
jgi:hypothetical protein